MTNNDWEQIVRRVTGHGSASELNQTFTSLASELTGSQTRKEVSVEINGLTNPQTDNASAVVAESTVGREDRILQALVQSVVPAQSLVESVSQPLLQTQNVLQSVISSVVPEASSNGANDAGGSIAGTLLSVVKGGFGLSTVVSGILSLFGGGDKKEELPPLVEFALPPSVQLEAGYSHSAGNRLLDMSYDQNGLPRQTPERQSAVPQVTVQVQTIDSQSFMDHSEAIARAVREAMLHSHSLNDVVTDL